MKWHHLCQNHIACHFSVHSDWSVDSRKCISVKKFVELIVFERVLVVFSLEKVINPHNTFERNCCFWHFIFASAFSIHILFAFIVIGNVRKTFIGISNLWLIYYLVNDTEYFDDFLKISQTHKRTNRTLLTNTVAWKWYFLMFRTCLTNFIFKFLMLFNARKHVFLSRKFNLKMVFGGTPFKFHRNLLNRYCVSPLSCKDCICWSGGPFEICKTICKYIYTYVSTDIVLIGLRSWLVIKGQINNYNNIKLALFFNFFFYLIYSWRQ